VITDSQRYSGVFDLQSIRPHFPHTPQFSFNPAKPPSGNHIRPTMAILPLCFHGLTICFSSKPFPFIIICVAPCVYTFRVQNWSAAALPPLSRCTKPLPFPQSRNLNTRPLCFVHGAQRESSATAKTGKSPLPKISPRGTPYNRASACSTLFLRAALRIPPLRNFHG
jgi:hypothetical protein